eukprot:CAMPEP_0172305300 /NCGR_PEP_ID=MMETSP1058-20130122/6623_1 /TAXON_ID=83371 /ORGANISM="Detonula confervacea, Strain CCMP 353" /LENGTH=273 /DNA_ID=CAMNT_0013016853 /DNA_START=66 /DNA_END=887 /DNA_ORIENTATION=-
MASSNNDLNQAKQRISQAISEGAPAYNAGDIKKCATLYQDAAKEIAPLLPPTFQTKLLQEVEEGNNESDATNYDAKAWALRKVFDSIVDYQLPLVPQDVAGEVTFDPYTISQLGGEPIGVMDNVMGGVSRGSWVSKSNLFFGETSLANNGGFASLRWRFPNVQNWSYAKGIYIKGLKHSKAQEHTFQIILKDATCERARLANFKAMFANPQQVDDQPLLIPFSVFNQMEQMGRPMVGSPAFNPMAVTEIGLMAIKPTVVGDFQLEFSEWGLYS